MEYTENALPEFKQRISELEAERQQDSEGSGACTGPVGPEHDLCLKEDVGRVEVDLIYFS